MLHEASWETIHSKVNFPFDLLTTVFFIWLVKIFVVSLVLTFVDSCNKVVDNFHESCRILT